VWRLLHICATGPIRRLFWQRRRSDGCQRYHVLHVLRLGAVEEETGSENYDAGQSGDTDADDGDTHDDAHIMSIIPGVGSDLAVATYMESAISA